MHANLEIRGTQIEVEFTCHDDPGSNAFEVDIKELDVLVDIATGEEVPFSPEEHEAIDDACVEAWIDDIDDYPEFDSDQDYAVDLP